MDYVYVIVLDKDLGYCRLFREDSEDIPAGEVLAAVKGLRRGYDAMIRFNNERRPVTVYHVCARERAGGESSYRILKTVADGWKAVETHTSHAEAKAALSRLLDERQDRRRRAAAEAREIMARTGIHGPRCPRFTDADLRYVAWLKETGRFGKQAA